VNWRRAIVCLLILVAAFAPAARAACDLERLTAQLGTNGADSPVAATERGSLGATPCADGSWCRDEPTALMRQAPAPATDGSLWLPLATPAAGGAEYPFLTLRTAFLGPVARRHAVPPTERAFRRVPRLLI
jgi:hypothetical protein